MLLSARCHRFLSSRPRLSILFRKTTQASTPSFPNFSADSLRQFSTSNSFNGHIVSWSHLLISFPRSNSCQQVLSQATPLFWNILSASQRAKFAPSISLPEIYSLPKKVLMRAALGLSPFPAPLPGHSTIDPAGQTTRSRCYLCGCSGCPVACVFLLPTPCCTVPRTSHALKSKTNSYSSSSIQWRWGQCLLQQSKLRVC